MPRLNHVLIVFGLHLCAFYTLALGFDRAALNAELDKVVASDPTYRRTTIALKVVDLRSGDVLYDRFGTRLFTPASNLKIYTSACALDLLGPQHSFATELTAQVDRAAGAIRGNLKIKGGGDAMLSSNELRMLVDRIVDEWKVRSLQGAVVVDNSRYSETRLGPGWMWDDEPYYYNMQVTPLMVDFNVRAVPGEFDSDGDPVREAVKNPSAWIAAEFTNMLRDRGVKIAQESRTNTAPVVTRTISYPGLPLAATLKHFNHVSENAVGEVLLHEVAIVRGQQKPGWTEGAKVITAWLHESAGLEKGSFRLVDGSGLSRYNLISADSSVQLLAFMRRHPHYQVFFDSLPAYGVEISPGVKEARVRAKPGGMSGVSTISGYLETLDGRQLGFSLLGNGFIGSSKPVRELRGKVWSVLVRYEGGGGGDK